MTIISYSQIGMYLGTMSAIYGAGVICGSAIQDLKTNNTSDILGKDYISTIIASLTIPLIGRYIGSKFDNANSNFVPKLDIQKKSEITKKTGITEKTLLKIAYVTACLIFLQEGFLSGETNGINLS